jgi:hypothetical protein
MASGRTGHASTEGNGTLHLRRNKYDMLRVLVATAPPPSPLSIPAVHIQPHTQLTSFQVLGSIGSGCTQQWPDVSLRQRKLTGRAAMSYVHCGLLVSALVLHVTDLGSKPDCGPLNTKCRKQEPASQPALATDANTTLPCSSPAAAACALVLPLPPCSL